MYNQKLTVKANYKNESIIIMRENNKKKICLQKLNLNAMIICKEIIIHSTFDEFKIGVGYLLFLFIYV